MIVGSANSVTATVTADGRRDDVHLRLVVGRRRPVAHDHRARRRTRPTRRTTRAHADLVLLRAPTRTSVEPGRTRTSEPRQLLRVRLNMSRVYMKFNVTGLSGAPSSAKLRLWVTDAGPNGGSVYSSRTRHGQRPGSPGTTHRRSAEPPLSSLGAATAGTLGRVRPRLGHHRAMASTRSRSRKGTNRRSTTRAEKPRTTRCW